MKELEIIQKMIEVEAMIDDKEIKQIEKVARRVQDKFRKDKPEGTLKELKEFI